MVEGRFRDARLGYPEPKAVRSRYAQLGHLISEDVAAGATRHTRLSWPVRRVPALVAVIDCLVLFTFCALIFNVALDAPWADPVRTLAAVMLAVLVTGAGYVWLAITGNRLRTFRGELGEILWRAIGATTWLMLGISAVIVIALAELMYSRVVEAVTEAGEALQAGAAQPLGLVLAVMSMVANVSVIAVHALDGSPQAEEHRHAGRLLRRHEKAVQRERLAVIKAAARCPWREIETDLQGFSAYDATAVPFNGIRTP